MFFVVVFYPTCKVEWQGILLSKVTKYFLFNTQLCVGVDNVQDYVDLHICEISLIMRYDPQIHFNIYLTIDKIANNHKHPKSIGLDSMTESTLACL